MTIRAIARSRGALVCAIAVGQFLLFEAGYRLTAGSEAAPAFQKLFAPDDRLGYRPAPGVSTRFKTAEFETDIHINAAGVRDREIGPRAPGERRIVVLGDSLVMAVQVPIEDTFTARLESRLNDRARRPGAFRVINAGVQGYGPVEEYLFHKHVTSALEPDVVVMALYAGNDAIEAGATASRLSAIDARLGRPAVEEPPQPSRWERLNQWRRRQIRKSIVLQVIRLRVTTLLGRFGWKEEIDPPLRTYLPVAPPEITRGLEVIRDVVGRARALADERGQRLVILLLPARFQVDDGDYSRLKAIVARSGRTLERDRATQRFLEMLADAGVPVCDVLPAMRATSDRDRLYFQKTAHFTTYGHQVIAEALDKFLETHGLALGTGDR